MATIMLSQILGLVNKGFWFQFLGSNTLGIISLLLSSGFLFQLVIAGALSSAFIPVFSDYLEKGKRRSNRVGSILLVLGLVIFSILAVILLFFQSSFKVFSKFSGPCNLLASLMRIIIIENCFYTEAFRLSFNLITIF